MLPLEFKIHNLVLIPSNASPIDIRGVYAELNIYESLYSATMYGTVVITDAINLFGRLPIFGFEKLLVEFSSPSTGTYSKTFRIFKVTDKRYDQDRTASYIVHFTTEPLITNHKTLVSKSYKNKLISDIADDIQNRYLGENFNHIEPTKFLYSYVIPNWNPIKTINWLAARANSSRYMGANYVYFENQYGFNFVSTESLVDENNETSIDLIYQPANVRNTNSLTYQRDTENDYRAIQSLKFPKLHDALSSIMTGMYGNRTFVHDIIRKTYRKYDFDYVESWDNYVHLEQNDVTNPYNNSTGKSFLSDQAGSDVSPDSLISFYPTSDPEFPSRAEEWLGQRISQMQQMQGIKLEAIIPGNHTVMVGDLVSVTLPAHEQLSAQTVDYDAYTRGRYLITSVRHIINDNAYTTVLELVKDSVYANYP